MTSEPVLSVEELGAFLSREFPQVDGEYVVEAVGPMTARVAMSPGDRHLRPGGTISGPTMFGLADCAVYLAIIAHVGPEALAVTTNASIDFMRKPEAGVPLVAEVELLKLGRGLAVGDVRILSRETLVARATLTYSRPR
ncbi:MAG: PaaI family thioesterase [Silicimonas sp.]